MYRGLARVRFGRRRRRSGEARAGMDFMGSVMVVGSRVG